MFFVYSRLFTVGFTELEYVITYSGSIKAVCSSFIKEELSVSNLLPVDFIVGDRINYLTRGYKDGDVWVIEGCQHADNLGQPIKCTMDAMIQIAFPLEVYRKITEIEYSLGDTHGIRTTALGSGNNFYSLDGKTLPTGSYGYIGIGRLLETDVGDFDLNLKFTGYEQTLKLRILNNK